MKTTLNWYKREANSYNTLGQRLLRKKYGFKGLGQFTSLCDVLVTLPNCSLDIKQDKNEVTMLALDLDFSPEDFICFLNKLLEFNLLIKITANKFSTKEIQESLSITMEERAKAYFRKYGKLPNPNESDSYNDSSGEPFDSSGEQLESSGEQLKDSKNFSQRERKEKPKKEEKQEREALALSVFNKDFLKEVEENFNVDEQIILHKQESFLKFFKMTKKKWKNEEDFRSHFLNWLKKELEKEKNSPKKEKVGERMNYE